jgi:hypothetical protein
VSHWEYIQGKWYGPNEYEPDGVVTLTPEGQFFWWAKREGEAAMMGDAPSEQAAKICVEQWLRKL